MSLRHVGIVVKDLDSMVEFYKLLGFTKIINDENLNGSLIDNLIGMSGVDLRIVKLKSKDDHSIIELLQYEDIRPTLKKKNLYDLGLSHLAIEVDNIDEIYEKLKSIGINFNSPPLLTKDNVRVCFCRDIEGNWVELVENLPVKKNKYLDVVYDEKSHPPSSYPQELINYLIKRFDIKKGSKILDAGCGRGDFSEAFRNVGMDVVGIDLNNNGNLSVYEVDFEKDRFPFEDNTFDYVISKSVLEHLNSPDLYVGQIYRVLKPNGKFILMTPEWDSCRYLFWDDYTHKQPYRLNTVRDLLLIHNFRDIEVQSFIQLPCVWKYSFLKYVCKFLQVFGAPKKIVKNKFLRWSRETIILSKSIKK